MTAKRFYDWQTAGGTDDVMRLVNCLERADIPWCAIEGVAVIHWADEPMVTQDADFVVATEAIQKAVELLEAEGFTASRFEGSVNFKGSSKVSLQLSTGDFYRDFASRSVPADVHGILLRVASLHDTLAARYPRGKNQGMEGDRAKAEQTHQGSGRYLASGGIPSQTVG